MRTFLQKCDKCGAKVLDDVIKIDDYTVTTFYLNKFHISFYCPRCIEKYEIVVDSKKDIEALGLPDLPNEDI